MTTPTSVRLPTALQQRVRARAALERRSLSNVQRVLIERGLLVSLPEPLVDEEEVERLAGIAREAIGEES